MTFVLIWTLGDPTASSEQPLRCFAGSMSLLPLLGWALLVLVQIQSGKSSVDLKSRHQPVSLMVQSLPDASSAHCPSCALARMRRNEGTTAAGDDLLGYEEEKAAQPDVVEAVKRHILNMLHLQARPNITRPVPRAALLNALRKLHVGRVAEDGSVQIEGEEESRGRGGPGGGKGGGAAAARAGDGGDAPETTEIITFAEAGESDSLPVSTHTDDITKDVCDQMQTLETVCPPV